MVSHDDLRLSEAARRKALWALADLPPGDPRATDALVILDDIERPEQRSPFPSVPSTERPDGTLVIRDMDIPQPWRERFHCASRGSTRFIDGAYYRDWENFLREWEKEMAHVERHRLIRRS